MAAKVARALRSKAEARMTWAQVRAFRARRHFLDARAPAGSLLRVVARLSGLHAQLLSSAELSAWARIDDLGAGEVTKALFRDRTLVKTWAMRGTLHLLPVFELGLWYAALGAFGHFLEDRWLRWAGLTQAQLFRILDAIPRALEQGPLGREELAAAVGRLTRSRALGEKVRESSWGMLLKPSAYRGELCFAESVGARVRFARPDRWVPAIPEAPSREDALREVTRRFLTAYGPATREDYSRFWGRLTLSEAGRRIASLGDELAEVDLEGRPAFLLRSDLESAQDARPVRSVRLLPAFDPYVVGASPHTAGLMPGNFRARIYRPQGWFTPVVLVSGRMDGVWKLERKARSIAVEIEPFVPLAGWARRGVEEEAERLAAFFGLPLAKVR
ncbi:MAG: winged helix DNA-binding domain-containing protein [Myxococcales bacterium]